MGKSTYSWTKSKIFNLIQKYEEAECLWNSNIEDYKSREKREAAITSICKNVNITREQFSKKIHNLRNQYNYEAKKVYKRNVDEKDDSKPFYYSKWEYFNALKFLKSVIAPRPGFSQIGINYDYELQQISTKSTYGEDEDPLSKAEQNVASPQNVQLTTDQEKKPTISYQSKELNIIDVSENRTSSPIIIEERTDTQTIEHYGSEIIEIQPVIKKSKLDDNNFNRNERNEYDIFGEFVAGELKSLNNHLSRKKLKRKIMAAILEVANEDDNI